MAYYNGDGVPKDLALAASWLSKAAGQGHSDAENRLGVMYAHGEGLPQDKEKAAALYQSAIKQGNKDAEQNLQLLSSIPK